MKAYKPNPTCMRNLLQDALDLVPRINEEDPMAIALADWCRRVRNTLTGQTDFDNSAPPWSTTRAENKPRKDTP